MRLMHYLVSRLVAVTALCLVCAIALSLVDAHRSIEAGASASADRVQQELQALYWQKLLWRGGMSRETLVPVPDWATTGTLTAISPGVCVAFAPPGSEPQRLCSQVEALGPVAPGWFAAIDHWVFGSHPPIIRPLSFHDFKAGTVTTTVEPSAALRQSWRQVSTAVWVAVALASTVLILAVCTIGRALRPFGTILAGLRTLEQGDRHGRLPAFRTAEFNRIADALNELAGTLTRLETARESMKTRLFQVQEEERRALARDLHDEFGQCLSATLALATLIESNAVEREETARDARAITTLQQRMFGILRSTLCRLRAQHIEEIGLEASLRQLFSDYKAQSGSRAVFRLHAFGPVTSIPGSIALNIYRIAQECLTNAVRHGSPTEVRVRLEHTPGPTGMVSLSVEDDGGGEVTLLNESSGHGMLGIRERIAALGGNLFIGRGAGGIRISAVIPVLDCQGVAAAGALS